MPFVEMFGWKVGCANFSRVITKDTSLPVMGAIDARQKVQLIKQSSDLFSYSSVPAE
jgi:hypothetical protein